MDARLNKYYIEMVRDITVAKMTSSTISVCKEGGNEVANFMQEIYNKLIELDQNGN